MLQIKYHTKKVNLDDIIDALFVAAVIKKERFHTKTLKNDIMMDYGLEHRFRLFEIT